MAINRSKARSTITASRATQVSTGVAAVVGITCAGLVLGMMSTLFAFNIVGLSVSIATIGSSTDSAYPFPGSVKVFGQRSITQTSNGAIVGNRVFKPAGLAVDTTSTATTALYVADAINNRILVYRSVGQCSNDATRSCSTDSDCGSASCTVDRNRLPDKVIGQANFNNGACNRDNNIGVNGNASASSLCFANYPKITNVGEFAFRIRITTDAQGNLYVADAMNNRVLRYNQPLSTQTTNGAGDSIADYVWGQADFSGRKPNRGGTASANSFSFENPVNNLQHTYGPGIAVDAAGNLWVADINNARVLRFPAGANGVPATTANLVLGQSSFSGTSHTCDGTDPYSLNPVPAVNTPLTSFCLPSAIQFDTTSQTLYVADVQTNRFRSRLLAFASPYQGAAAVHEIVITNPGFVSFPLTSNKFYYFPQIWDMALNTSKTGTLSSGIMWIVEGLVQRAALIDAQGNIVKVVNAVDTDHIVNPNDINYRGGSYSNACKQTNHDNGHLQNPGAVAMDTRGNLYLADNTLQKVSILNTQQYQPVTFNGARCLPPTGVKSLFGRPDGWMNSVDNFTYDGAVGAIAWNGQLIGQGNQRLMVWNDYKTKQSGAAADFVLGKFGEGTERTQPENTALGGWSDHAVDSLKRLWTGGDSYDIIVYQLPLTAQSVPIARYDMDALVWSDTGTAISSVDHRPNPISFAYDVRKRRIWMNDGWNNRLLGFRVDQPLSTAAGTKLVIDKVIGQPNKNTMGCNSTNNPWSWLAPTSARPTDKSLCQPTIVKFDQLGNLYVVESTYECHGNNRIIMYSRQTLKDIENTSTLFPYPAASKVFIAQTFTSPPDCSTTNKKPGRPTGIAFSNTNQMVIGTDGYYSYAPERAITQLFFYNNPLLKKDDGTYFFGQLPDAVIPLPLGASGELNFDEDDNLIVQDHTWPRILLINYKDEPNWLSPVYDGVYGSVSIATISDGQVIVPGTSLGVAVTKFNVTDQSITVTLVNKDTGASKLVYQGTGNIFTLDTTGVEPGDYWLRVISGASGAKGDIRLVAIHPETDLLITAPTNGSVLYLGNTAKITWQNYTPGISGFRIVLNKSGGTTQTLIADNISATTTNYPWTIPADIPPGSYTIKVIALDSAKREQRDTEVAITISRTDAAAPTASITAPINGATLSGIVTVTTTVADNVGVTKVELWIDGTVYKTVTTVPYTFTWDTSKATIGSHSLRLRAFDTAGNVGASGTITVKVTDGTAPTVLITAPTNFATVSGTVTITATASDNVGVAKVEFWVDNILLGNDTTAPYSFAWNTGSIAIGSHLLQARAYDAAGNIRTSATITVNKK